MNKKNLFIGLFVLTFATSSYATWKCCSSDTVELCGDECCKTACDSNGRCPNCPGEGSLGSDNQTCCYNELAWNEGTNAYDIEDNDACQKCPNGGEFNRGVCCKDGYSWDYSNSYSGYGIDYCGCPEEGDVTEFSYSSTSGKICCKDKFMWNHSAKLYSYINVHCGCPNGGKAIEGDSSYYGRCCSGGYEYNTSSQKYDRDSEACCSDANGRHVYILGGGQEDLDIVGGSCLFPSNTAASCVLQGKKWCISYNTCISLNECCPIPENIDLASKGWLYCENGKWKAESSHPNRTTQYYCETDVKLKRDADNHRVTKAYLYLSDSWLREESDNLYEEYNAAGESLEWCGTQCRTSNLCPCCSDGTEAEYKNNGIGYFHCYCGKTQVK